MDMWKPYINATRAQLYGAEEKIVHDPFHLHRHMNEAVNQVRKQEHAILHKQGDERLSETRYYRLYCGENRPDRVMEAWLPEGRKPQEGPCLGDQRDVPVSVEEYAVV